MNNFITAQSLIVIDGLKDTYWNAATAHIHINPENIDFGEVVSENDCSGDLYMAYDENYLYGFAEIKDDSISSKNDDTWWENDAINLIFDLYPATIVSYLEHAVCCGYDLVGVSFTAETGFGAAENGPNNTIISRILTDSSYNIEFAIPFNEIVNYNTEPPETYDPVLGKQIGFLFEIRDQDFESSNDGVLVWGNYSINGDYWIDVKQLGSMTLLDNNQIQLSHDNLVTNRTIYIDSSNISGAEDGTQEYPFNNIQEGIDAALRGDTVLVYPGRYKENISFNGRSIVLTSLQMITGDNSYISRTIIDGDKKGRVITITEGEDSTTVLNGFSIVNGGHPDYCEGGIGIFASSEPQLTNLIIRDNYAENSGGGINCNPGNPIIKNCKIFNNSTNGWGGGVVFHGKSNAILENVLIYKNESNTSGGGFGCLGESTVSLTNVTIVNNTAMDNSETAFGDESKITFKNSILWNNLPQEIIGNVEATYSNIKGGYSGTGNINEDPLFVNAEAGDYRLQEGSPCINVGIPDTIGLKLSSTDITGNPRIYNGRIDMGAYESIIPDAPDTIICYGEPAINLIASGNDIKWYSDELLSNILYHRDTLTVEASKPVTDVYYTYYVTQTINENESVPNKVLLTVKPSPEKPEIRLKGEDILICLDSGMYSYNWYFQNEQFINETKQFFEVKNQLTGTYYVETGFENQCKTKSDPYNFTAKSGTLKDSEPYVEIYPVPNAGNFWLTMPGSQSGRVLINIRDFSGKNIKSLIIDKNTEPLFEEINLLNVSEGLYIIEILFNKETYFKKILID